MAYSFGATPLQCDRPDLGLACFSGKTVNHTSGSNISDTIYADQNHFLMSSKEFLGDWAKFAVRLPDLLCQMKSLWAKLHDLECELKLAKHAPRRGAHLRSLTREIEMVKSRLRFLHGWDLIKGQPSLSNEKEQVEKPDVGGYLNACWIFWFRVLLSRNENQLVQRAAADLSSEINTTDVGRTICLRVLRSREREAVPLPRAIVEFFHSDHCNISHFIDSNQAYFNQFTDNIDPDSLEHLAYRVYCDSETGAFAHLVKFSHLLCEPGLFQCDSARGAKIRENFRNDVKRVLEEYGACEPMSKLSERAEQLAWAQEYDRIFVSPHDKQTHKVCVNTETGEVNETDETAEAYWKDDKTEFKVVAAKREPHETIEVFPPLLYAEWSGALKRINDINNMTVAEILITAVSYCYHPKEMTCKIGDGKVEISDMKFDHPSPLKNSSNQKLEFTFEKDLITKLQEEYKKKYKNRTGVDVTSSDEPEHMGKVLTSPEFAKLEKEVHRELSSVWQRGAEKHFHRVVSLLECNPTTFLRLMVSTPAVWRDGRIQYMDDFETELSLRMGKITTWPQSVEQAEDDAWSAYVQDCFGGSGRLDLETFLRNKATLVATDSSLVKVHAEAGRYQQANNTIRSILQNLIC